MPFRKFKKNVERTARNVPSRLYERFLDIVYGHLHQKARDIVRANSFDDHIELLNILEHNLSGRRTINEINDRMAYQESTTKLLFTCLGQMFASMQIQLLGNHTSVQDSKQEETDHLVKFDQELKYAQITECKTVETYHCSEFSPTENTQQTANITITKPMRKLKAKLVIEPTYLANCYEAEKVRNYEEAVIFHQVQENTTKIHTGEMCKITELNNATANTSYTYQPEHRLENSEIILHTPVYSYAPSNILMNTEESCSYFENEEEIPQLQPVYVEHKSQTNNCEIIPRVKIYEAKIMQNLDTNTPRIIHECPTTPPQFIPALSTTYHRLLKPNIYQFTDEKDSMLKNEYQHSYKNFKYRRKHG